MMDVQRILAPPRGCAELPDIGGIIRARLEDFDVEELPAYEPDGGEGHVLVWLRKRGLSSEEAVREVSRQLRIARGDIGVAGLKDRDAVTRQQISVPARAAANVARFTHPQIELSEPRPHSHKLRRGHLRGNRFVIIVRELAIPIDEAERRVRAKLDCIARAGLRNVYGVQRFGKDGRNIEVGLAALAGRNRRARSKGDLSVSAGQSALFNLYLATRAERGLLSTVLRGDILEKRETGGMFECSDPAIDQARLDAGELVVTGPMFGGKMRAPTAGTPAAELEAEVLAVAGLDAPRIAKLGRHVPGTRRRLAIWPTEVAVAVAADDALELRFCLPAGSYATVLLRELCG